MMKRIKRWLRCLYQRTVYAYSYLFVILSGKKAESDKLLLQFKDKYKGQRCFIIGNGPSLTPQDLEKLKGEVTFATNRIYKIFSQTDWRPTFYGISDEGVAGDPDVIAGASAIDCEMKFFRQEGYYRYRRIKGNECYIHSWWSRKYLDNPRFSRDLCKGMYTIATVTYGMAQIAVWMGFKEIYLLGMDNRYAATVGRDGSVKVNEGVKSYFAQTNQNIQTMPAATWEMDTAYEYLEKYSRGSDFRVYNATRGGYLEKFERVDFDSLF